MVTYEVSKDTASSHCKVCLLAVDEITLYLDVYNKVILHENLHHFDFSSIIIKSNIKDAICFAWYAEGIF